MGSRENISVAESHPLWGICFIVLGLFMLLALVDYQPEYSKFYQVSSKAIAPAANRLGLVGMTFAFYTCRYIGLAAWLLPIYMLYVGILTLLGRQSLLKTRRLMCFLGCLIFMSIGLGFLQHLRWMQPHYQFYSAGVGGIVGIYLFEAFFIKYLGPIGSGLVLFPCALLTLLLSFTSLEWVGRRSIIAFNRLRGYLSRLKAFLWSKIHQAWRERPAVKLPFKGWLERVGQGLKKWRPSFPKKAEAKPLEEEPVRPSMCEIETPTETVILRAQVVKKSKDSKIQEAPKDIQILASEEVEKATEKLPTQSGDYQLPPLNLLKDPPPVLNDGNADDYYEIADDLVQKLAEFGVEVKVEAIQSGPVITRYEVTPARGVRVEKITTLDKNIALGLKALSVRIQAPVPGKGCVGIEIPNKKALPVCLKEILGSKAWSQSDAEIPIVLGKEVTGKPIVADLTKMPHLLIAGSTGSGKTVCINAIIASLLFRASPKDLRFIMVDPKIVEMKIYNDLPHMLIPVVTDPKRVPSALKWLIAEMERRYQLFADLGARNIAGFNSKLIHMSDDEKLEKGLEHLPYIICIIDELADLMMVAPGDVETCIARLAQLARAAGIHLIIATQRPSVNVITGIIKANLPSRIAFKVASKVDSRTILDTGGADALIGRGDMLFIPPGASQLVRAQGAWVSDDEITDLVEYLKCNGRPQFVESVQQMLENDADDDDAGAIAFSDDEDDALIPQALEVLKTSDRISTSLLQRRLKIGYNRAARIMDTLDERGLLPKDSNLG